MKKQMDKGEKRRERGTLAPRRVNYWHLFNKLLDDNVSFDVVRLLAFWYSHQNVAV